MKKIAIIGSPGSGKSTIASGIFYFLKKEGFRCELVPELIKYKVYQGMKFNDDGFDILNTLEQKELEENIGKAPNLEYLICEAPLCNGFFYSSFYSKDAEIAVLKRIAEKMIQTYELFIFVEHEDSEEYETFGRKEDKTTSLKLEQFIKDSIVNDLSCKKELFFVHKNTDIQTILNKIKST